MSNFADVKTFMDVVGEVRYTTTLLQLRIIAEEVYEFIYALNTGEGVEEEYADMLFTIVGLGYLLGIDVEEAFGRVCKKNLAKLERFKTGTAKFDETGKLLKEGTDA